MFPVSMGYPKMPENYTNQGAVNIDGRPSFAKPSVSDVQQVEIAAIDPDFDRGHGLCP